LQPVVRFVDRVPIPVKSVHKTFFGPVIQVVGWVERNKVPGWATREPTVLPPAALPILPTPSAPAPTETAAKKPGKTKKGAAKPGPDDIPSK
jgi:hypothetical protein